MKYYHKTTIFTIHHYTFFLFYLLRVMVSLQTFIFHLIYITIFVIFATIHNFFNKKPNLLRVMVSLQPKYKKFLCHYKQHFYVKRHTI